ncbi:MGDG synthase family glycosyltransferase [Alicyclobacillus pomorum]|jgi:processive 1,2-diacylglycerol beta-glucosyltransferase|uniref:MGDG synthase family glycosyltransferase n=1 Tax=Alicyclobacillus pomorum TaxID=204470 RepID=UPI000408BA0F|nr:glycosyltransferase [Alicyclobacillus pomorum]
MPRVLLFTASFGSGHNQACHAVKEMLEERGAVVKVVDLVKLLHPSVRPIVTRVFLQVLKKAPWLYGVMYDALSTNRSKSFVERQLFRLGRRKISSILQSFQPDVVCSTHPTSVGIVSELRARGMTSVPNVEVITDYTVHGHWVHPNVDLYCVACEEVGRELQRMGVPARKIHVTGLPIRKVFNEMQEVRDDPSRRLQLRLKNGIDGNKPLFLVMGGGEGIIGTASMWERITKRVDAQFVIVCGKNQRLYHQLRDLESNNVRVFGYVPNIEQWMAMADMLVTKAGGLTMTEAFSLGLPMLLFRPIPGQEYANACYAVKRGAAQLFYSLADAERIMSEFVAEREQRAKFHLGTANRDTSKASNRIAQLLLHPELLMDVETPIHTWIPAASE